MHNNPPPPNFYNKNNIAMVYQKVHHLIHILKYQIPQNNLLYLCMNMLSMNYQMIQLDRITYRQGCNIYSSKENPGKNAQVIPRNQCRVLSLLYAHQK